LLYNKVYGPKLKFTVINALTQNVLCSKVYGPKIYRVKCIDLKFTV